MMSGDKKQVEYISYGGGTPSLALIILNIKGEIKPITGRDKVDEIIFSDTGWEKRKTIEQLELHKEYVEKHGYKMTIVKSELGNLDEQTINAINSEEKSSTDKFVHIPFFKFNDLESSEYYGTPTMQRRQCTNHFKIKPINDFLKNKYGRIGHIAQLGIHLDEIHRVKDARNKKDINRHPGVDLGLTRQDCINIVKESGLPVLPKSGCVGCPFMNSKVFINMANNKKDDDFERAVAVDEEMRKIGGYVWREMKPLKTLRENVQSQMFNLDDDLDDGCDSGYCFV